MLHECALRPLMSGPFGNGLHPLRVIMGGPYREWSALPLGS